MNIYNFTNYLLINSKIINISYTNEGDDMKGWPDMDKMKRKETGGFLGNSEETRMKEGGDVWRGLVECEKLQKRMASIWLAWCIKEYMMVLNRNETGGFLGKVSWPPVLNESTIKSKEWPPTLKSEWLPAI